MAAAIGAHLDYYWRDQSVRNALTGMYERQQAAFHSRHNDASLRNQASKRRQELYKLYNVEPW
jgi:fructosamine-3-kinase